MWSGEADNKRASTLNLQEETIHDAGSEAFKKDRRDDGKNLAYTYQTGMRPDGTPMEETETKR